MDEQEVLSSEETELIQRYETSTSGQHKTAESKDAEAGSKWLWSWIG